MAVAFQLPAFDPVQCEGDGRHLQIASEFCLTPLALRCWKQSLWPRLLRLHQRRFSCVAKFRSSTIGTKVLRWNFQASSRLEVPGGRAHNKEET